MRKPFPIYASVGHSLTHHALRLSEIQKGPTIQVKTVMLWNTALNFFGLIYTIRARGIQDLGPPPGPHAVKGSKTADESFELGKALCAQLLNNESSNNKWQFCSETNSEGTCVYTKMNHLKFSRAHP